MTQPQDARRASHGAPDIPGVCLEGILGRGGFATVYAGIQVSLQRPVAVKIDSRPLDDERNRRRFLREMSAASRIAGHPHVVTPIDTGVLPDKRPYLVMERCDGGTLADALSRGPLAPADAVRIVEAVSSALGAAHSAGVLHRDIKPGNILIDAYGSPRLSDFGIAAVQRDDAQSVTLEALTPAFAPPEAFMLAEPTASGDVWSMGAVLLALVTGRGPRQGPDGRLLSLPGIMEGLNTPVDTSDPRIPPGLRRIIDKAMHPKPEERYRNGAELTTALAGASRLLGSGTMAVYGPLVTTHLAAAKPADPPLPVRSPGRTAGILLAGAIIGALLTGAAVVTALSLRPPVSSSATQSTGAPETRRTPSAGVTPSRFEREPVASVSPAQVNSDGIPYSDDMPWELGTCLHGSVGVTGVSTAQPVDCDEANWFVFAGGSMDPGTTAETSAEAIAKDPQAKVICTADYAGRYGLDLNGSYEIRILGPTQEQWDDGSRGFSCVYARL